jgi:phosphate uptake regulator
MDGVRLYGRDFPHPDTEKVYELQQAMDRLWQAVQNQLINTVCDHESDGNWLSM